MAKTSANILLLGLGGVGTYLAKRLTQAGHAITVIESDPDRIREVEGDVDARLIRGDAMSFSCWDEADPAGMDFLIAVTDNDAVNIMSSQIADRAGIRRKIARVRSLQLWEPGALLTPDDVKIDFLIRPEELAAQEIARLLKMRAGNVVVDVAGGDMEVLAIRVGADSPLRRRTLREIAEEVDHFHFRIVAIARGISTVIPGGDQTLHRGDHVYFLVHSADLPRMMEAAGVTEERRHRVMIIGGGLIGTRVAELLEDDLAVTLVERDGRRAEELSYLLKKTQCLHGDGSDPETLIQAGLLDVDTLIAATGDNETNIMTTLLAKQRIRTQPRARRGRRAGKTIALVKREEYLTLASSMGADIVLNAKVLAGNEILRYIRRGHLLSVAHLHGCDAEVVELRAGKGASAVGVPLYQVKGMAGKILIGGVCRSEKWRIAVGSTVIEAGDRVVAICASQHLPELQKLLDA